VANQAPSDQIDRRSARSKTLKSQLRVVQLNALDSSPRRVHAKVAHGRTDDRRSRLSRRAQANERARAANRDPQIEYLAEAISELAKAAQELNRRVESGLASKP
jgi:hypothetical protein